MKTLNSAVVAARQARAGTSAHGLIWVTAKDRVTGAAETIGFWTGLDHRDFTIKDVDRTYFGAGNVLDLGDTVAEVGVQIRMRTVTLSGLTAEVQQAMKGYDARLAPVEIHRAEFDTDTGNLLAEPERIAKGWIDKVNWADGAKQDDGTASFAVTISIASASRALTRTLAQKFSDASQKLRNAADAFFQYVDVSSDAQVYWGDKRVPSSGVTSANAAATRSLQKVGAV